MGRREEAVRTMNIKVFFRDKVAHGESREFNEARVEYMHDFIRIKVDQSSYQVVYPWGVVFSVHQGMAPNAP